MSARARILIAEEIADAGVALLRERFDVDVGVGWTPEELAERLPDYHGILIRSGTRLTADVIGRAPNLRVIGRAGIGVDNVDVAAATKQGVVVANAPESNVIAAAEHTMALMLALARHVPQAHRSLTEGRWERGRFAGSELYEKTLGVFGFGRIGQLVAARAKAFGMHVLAFDAFVSAERYRELGVEQASSSTEVYRRSDFITIHLPRTAETRGWLDAEAFAQMRDGVFVINCARGDLVVEEALKDALDSGKVGGAAHPGRRAGGGGVDRGRGEQRGQHPDRPRRGPGGARSLPALVRAAGEAGHGARGRFVGRPHRARIPGPGG